MCIEEFVDNLHCSYNRIERYKEGNGNVESDNLVLRDYYVGKRFNCKGDGVVILTHNNYNGWSLHISTDRGHFE